MLVSCWSTVYDAGPTLNQHLFHVLCLLGSVSTSIRAPVSVNTLVVLCWANVTDSGKTLNQQSGNQVIGCFHVRMTPVNAVPALRRHCASIQSANSILGDRCEPECCITAAISQRRADCYNQGVTLISRITRRSIPSYLPASLPGQRLQPVTRYVSQHHLQHPGLQNLRGGGGTRTWRCSISNLFCCYFPANYHSHTIISGCNESHFLAVKQEKLHQQQAFRPSGYYFSWYNPANTKHLDNNCATSAQRLGFIVPKRFRCAGPT